MNIKALSLLVAVGLIAFAAWLINRPDHSPDVQAGERDFSERQLPEKYHTTVAKALAYLAKHQHKDGHWEGDDGKHPVAMTGLVGLALLMDSDGQAREGRHRPMVTEKHKDNIDKAADWLMAKSRGRDGLIFAEHASETGRYMEGHAFATLFLAGVCRDRFNETRHSKIVDVVTHAVKYIVRAQSTQGGWYHTSKVEGHDFDRISTTVMQIQALQAAEQAGIPIPDGALETGRAYLRMALGKGSVQAKNPRIVDVAGALAVSETTGRQPEADEHSTRVEWGKLCETEIPKGRDIKFGRDELLHYYHGQAMFNLGGDKNWTSYRTATFDHLQATQNKDGSWPAADGIGVGPVYATALWCIVLQLEHNRHPTSHRRPDIVK